MPSKYKFITHWQIEAPLASVWDAIYNSMDWPNWWKGVNSVVEIKKNDSSGVNGVRHYVWKSVLPYQLAFDMKLIEKEDMVRLKGVAFGELDGMGEWHFQIIDGFVDIIYNWEVITTKKWMNSLAFILKPLFKLNHNVVMHWGAEGLAKKVNGKLIKG